MVILSQRDRFLKDSIMSDSCFGNRTGDGPYPGVKWEVPPVKGRTIHSEFEIGLTHRSTTRPPGGS